MGKFTGILLASDFDRTLVGPTLTPSQKVAEALAYFMDNGGLFTVNTGRTHRIFDLDPKYMNAPVILGNGALLMDWTSREILHLSPIGDEGLAPVRDVRDFFPKVMIELHVPGDVTYSLHMEQEGYTDVSDPADAPRPWIKSVMIGSREEIAGVQKFLAAYHRNNVSFFPTTGGWLEVVRCGVSKGTGLKLLAKRLGIPMDKVFAVGDGHNDVEMLQTAAIGFVPENGEAEALAVADRIVPSVENHTVAHVIEILDKMF